MFNESINYFLKLELSFILPAKNTENNNNNNNK